MASNWSSWRYFFGYVCPVYVHVHLCAFLGEQLQLEQLFPLLQPYKDFARLSAARFNPNSRKLSKFGERCYQIFISGDAKTFHVF